MPPGELFGCEISAVKSESLPIDAVHLEHEYSYVWLLAHCDDGVTWGYRDSGGWHLSSALGLSPRPTAKNIQQMRLFGEAGELLLWRKAGGFAGRMVNDRPLSDIEEWAKPSSELRILAGNKILAGGGDGFTVIGDDYGRRHAVPLECAAADFRSKPYPLRLVIRHYFERDLETGVVRIAVSRLVRLTNLARTEAPR